MRKQLTIKLGSKCNFSCKYCHCKEVEYEFNPDILDYIKKNDYTVIRFSGGEPLKYMDIIKTVMEYLGTTVVYDIVTNGSLLTPTLVNYFNQFDVRIGLSCDGDNSTRETFYASTSAIRNLANKISPATVIYNENNNVPQTIIDVRNMLEIYNAAPEVGVGVFPYLAHEISTNTHLELTEETIQNYISAIEQLCIEDIQACKMSGIPYYKSRVLNLAQEIFNDTKTVDGVRCFNNYRHTVTIAGDFLLCPYQEETLGDIYTGIDYNKINQYIPDKCKVCSFFKICKNSCIMSITDTPCRVFRELHPRIKMLFEKHLITSENFYDKI